MITLDMQSEKYSATGNASSEGVKNQLGRPDMDVIEVLVRETVQNSWDAKSPDKRTVLYDISGWELDAEQRSVLHQNIFSYYPDNVGWERFEDKPIAVLAISDRNTNGLGGPTRADEVSDEDEARDFVDFIRNVGTPRDKHLGGGTYGFGKSSLYLASNIGTICVYTRCKRNGGLESRFMAVTLGPSYSEVHGRRKGMYTGRHWWGLKADDGIVDPVTGRSADALARGLGLPVFDHDETGTTLVIILPRMEDIPVDEIGLRFQSALLWSFWPKMLHGFRQPSGIRFSLSWNGKNIPIQQPHDVAPLATYVQAMENLKAFREGDDLPHEGKVAEIRSKRPNRLLGHLSLVKSIRNHGMPRLYGSADGDSDISPTGQWGPEQRSHHVALMRDVELVVKYLEAPPLTTDLLEYGGVFVTDQDADDAFARAEPPTHDDWKPDILNDSSERTMVRVAFREIKAITKQYAAPATSDTPDTGQVSLGRVSGMLGDLVPTLESGGASVVPGSQKRSKKTGRKSQGRSGMGISILNEGNLIRVGEKTAVSYQFSVTRPSQAAPVTIEVEPQVLINDGNSVEREEPEGEAIPEVLYWEDSSGKRRNGGTVLEIDTGDSDEWSVVIALPEDALTGVNFSVRGMDD